MGVGDGEQRASSRGNRHELYHSVGPASKSAISADTRSVIRAFLAASHFFGVLKSCNGGVLLEEVSWLIA